MKVEMWRDRRKVIIIGPRADDGGKMFYGIVNDFNAHHIKATINERTLRETGAGRLISTIESTGGVIQEKDGTYVPGGCEDWTDLGDAYIAACRDIGRKPMVKKRGRS